MSKKVNIRKTYIQQRKQLNFHLGQSINDMVIPSYNALKDPFLSGFFQHPGMRINLRKTGIIVRKKRFSLQKYQEAVSDPKLLHSAEKMAHKRAKSETKKKDSQILPQLEEQRIDAREWLKSENQSRTTKVYKSKKLSFES